ncbi:hypothetical protein [Rhodococcus jostii]|uniref:hypothetical protein n=1 Tax=Rhodococcus jostii TaxID=132919 RepID=UPI003645D83B
MRIDEWWFATASGRNTVVDALLPSGSGTYVRVFPPAIKFDDYAAEIRVPWREVARAHGTVMHPGAEWGSITRTWNPEPWDPCWDEAPNAGGVDEGTAHLLAGLLAESNDGDAVVCNIARWATPRRFVRMPIGASVSRPEADFDAYMLSGSRVSIAASLGDAFTVPCAVWPKSGRWCVRIHDDLITPYVYCSDDDLAGRLIASEELEVLRIEADQRFSWDCDEVNPLPAPPYAT